MIVDPYRHEPFGELPADEYRTVTVTSETSAERLPLHVEIVGPASAPVTVVFAHGFAADLGTFHFQRRALSRVDGVRAVYYDQPGHGRSGRLARGEYTIDLLGRALRAVIDACVQPGSRVVLVGYSLGGMAVLALAEQAPSEFQPGGRVAGVALLSTSASGVVSLPTAVDRLSAPVLSFLRSAGTLTGPLLDRARRTGQGLTRRLLLKRGFGAGFVGPSLVSYVEQMQRATASESVARYLRAFYTHDRTHALAALTRVPVLVVCGDEDQVLPLKHSQLLARALPEAELVVLPGAGHLALMECGDDVSARLVSFVHECG